MIQLFSAKNFRNINVSDLEFERLNLFVGPNNSGKSNLIRAIGFFPDMLKVEKLSGETAFQHMLRKNRWDELLRRDIARPDTVELALMWTGDAKGRLYNYSLKFQVEEAELIPNGFYIQTETVSEVFPSDHSDHPGRHIMCHKQVPGRGLFGYFESNSQAPKTAEFGSISAHETVIRQGDTLLDQDEFRVHVFPDYKKMTQSITDYFSRFQTYACNDFNLGAVSEASEISLFHKSLKQDGSDFVNVLAYLDEKYNFLDDYTDRLRELIPDLRRLKIVHVSEKKRQLQLIIGAQTYKLYEMSFGTIQAMLLTLLLWTPEKMSILTLDEPEINLHPAWVKVMGNWALKSPSAEQLFISTHSPDFLDRFTEQFRAGDVALFTFSLKDESTVRRVDPQELDEFFQQGWELGDLYRAGEPLLGGWPW